MTNKDKIEIDHQIIHNRTTGDFIVILANSVLSVSLFIGLFLLSQGAIKLCATQCSGENCKYVIEGLTRIATYGYIFVGWFVFCTCKNQDATIKMAQKTAKQIGGIFTSFKKGCSSEDEEK